MKDELERLMLAHSPRLKAILAAARQRIDAGAGISDDERGFPRPKKSQPSYNCAQAKVGPEAVISLTFFPFI